ncbi:MAG: TonB-dependent receptor [Pseudomonadota bacterium]
MSTRLSLGAAFLLGTSTLAATAMIPTLAQAQVTTSSVRGFVQSDTGSAVSNALVQITNTETGFTRVVATDGNGAFSIRNLSITGAYDIEVTAESFQGERVEGVMLSLGDSTELNFVLAGGEFVDEVIVVAQRQVLAELAIGPNASFGLETLENAPAINRTISDIVRIDPRIAVDESRGGINAIQCAGQNSRFNSLTLDGVQLNDAFGLNSNGFPTERQPFPFDALEQVAVELAPLDVIYGNFTACNINAVTKSGTNTFSGSAFIDYTDDGLRGDTAGDQTFDFGTFDEIRYGATIGGPIIEDKLFFFVGYEKLEGANTYPNTSVTLGNGPFQVSQAVVDEIAQIARDVYQYDPGFIPDSNPNADEKVLVKLDWNISDNHRATGTFQWNDGFNIVRSDGDTNELEFSNHLYERGTELFSYSGAIFSDWTDNFSTELRAAYTDIDNRQISVGGTEFGEIRVDTGPVDVYLGGDDSRSANDLNYDVLDLIFRANYTAGSHNFTFGAELQELNIFNLFIQQAQTEIRFNSVDDFRNGIASQVEFNNSPSLNPLDAAAEFGYTRNAVYLQDEWNVSPDFTVVAGLRYDWYSSDDVPVENPDFVASYGFSNAQNFDGVDLIQPRVGFTWDATSNLQIHGGVGRYSGGNPNVWLSNNYSSNNVTQVGARIRGAIDLFSLNYVLAEDGVPNGPGWAVPQELADSVATGQGRNFEINYLDPDFTVPSEWKYSLGATWNPIFDTGESLFGGEWFFQTDLLWSQSENTAIVLRGDLVETGTQVIDGVTYPTFSSPLLDSFTLTNADIENESFVFSFGAAKEWDNGFSARIGYAYSDAKDVQPMTSSVAFSNYNNRAFTNPQEQILSTSNYNTKHRFTANVSYEKDFFGDYLTRFDTFFLSQSGQPYSRTQDGVANDIYRFTPFLGNGENSILLPGTERNQFTSPSWTKIDLRISQELPGLRADDRAEVFMVIDNLTNLINNEWGILEQVPFPGTRVRNAVGGDQPFSINAASTYEIRFGARYDF